MMGQSVLFDLEVGRTLMNYDWGRKTLLLSNHNLAFETEKTLSI